MSHAHPPKLSISVVVLVVLLLACAGEAVAAARDHLLYRLPAVTSTADIKVKQTAISYRTAGGFTRVVRLAVRIPALPQQQLPTVIWAHGGGEQPDDRPAASVLPEWGEATARAGYLSINVVHGTNHGRQRLRLCESIGYPLDDPAAMAAALHGVVANMAAAAAAGTRPAIDVAALAAQFPALFADRRPATDAADEDTVDTIVQRLSAAITGCNSINNLGLWDRPHDIEAVINALHDGLIPELNGWVDLHRIAVAGHSNGSNSALNAIGLRRALPNGVKVAAPFPPPLPERPAQPRRPVAAIALSPMGVNNYGLYDTAAGLGDDAADHSWRELADIPVMTLTGDGDNHCKPGRFVCNGSDSTGKRLIPFFRMPRGDRYLVLISDARTGSIVSSHERFGRLEHAACPPASEARCRETERWLKSAIIAFLDAHLHDSRQARSWLASDRLSRASNGIAAIVRK